MMRICRQFTAQADGSPVYLDAELICGVEGVEGGSRLSLTNVPFQFAVREQPQEIVRRLDQLFAQNSEGAV